MKNARLIIVSVLCFALFGAAVFFMRDKLFGGVVGTYEEAALNQAEYEGKWVTYEAVACLGMYAEATETHNFIPTGHEYYYLIWMEDGSIMPLSVSKKADREYLDALTDATYDYLDGKTKLIEMEPRTFTGSVKNQETEALSYYNNALREMGTTEADGFTVRYVLMDCTETRAGLWLLVGACMLIPILGITVTVVSIRKEKRKKELTGEQGYLPK